MGLLSRVVNPRAGTPQGSCLSPLIYIISVNDIPTGNLWGTSQFQFAADIAISGNGKDEMITVSKVQKGVNDRGLVPEMEGLTECDKSHLVIFSQKRKKNQREPGHSSL